MGGAGGDPGGLARPPPGGLGLPEGETDMSDTDDRDREPSLDAAYALSGPQDARRLYAAWAETYDDGFAVRSGYRPARRVAEIFVAAGGEGPILDAGCGTGLVADALPRGSIVDGIDLSEEMLAMARRKGLYRTLVPADLTLPLPFDTGSYRGVLCAGTFTHGHVGPEALPELVRVLAPGGLMVLSVRPDHAEATGFHAVLDGLASGGAVALDDTVQEPVYEGPEPPDGHADDQTLFLTLRRCGDAPA
jgi:SAM-dependent methyltransferase